VLHPDACRATEPERGNARAQYMERLHDFIVQEIAHVHALQATHSACIYRVHADRARRRVGTVVARQGASEGERLRHGSAAFSSTSVGRPVHSSDVERGAGRYQ
jgi:hypothetical protein